MTKIAFINTETNGLHKQDMTLTKTGFVNNIPKICSKYKNVYKFANILSLQYSIGVYDNNSYEEKIKKKLIFNHENIIWDEAGEKYNGITREYCVKKGKNPKECLEEFIKDIKYVDYIVFHSADYHIKAIQAELMRNYLLFNFNNYTIIDIMNFYHNISYPKLTILAEKYLSKTSKSKIKMIKNVFFKLYKEYVNKVVLKK